MADNCRISRILAALPEDDARWLEAQLLPPWQRRARRLAERDDALRQLAGTYAGAASGRDLGQSIARDLARYAAGAWRFDRSSASPSDPCHALHHRILILNRGAVLGEKQVRRILAGSRTPVGHKESEQCPTVGETLDDGGEHEGGEIAECRYEAR